jgi:cellulose synthase/poly-beta-1,6-N-acetylglucosamine synthase-like glycosyltransferase
MIVYLSIIAFLFIGYSLLILYYWRNWRSIPDFIAPSVSSPLLFSVIIPARNEEKNIAHLLNALARQTYPADWFEVIVVDDHSTDNTVQQVKQCAGVQLVSLKEDAINSYKKKAIEAGIGSAKGEWIITTDADCIPGKNWLSTIAAFIAVKKPVFIAAPVCFTHQPSLLSIFQSLDFLTLQGITGASVYKNIHSMCNGANMAYQRNAFYEVGGFKGIDHIASGDDMLLMHKIWKQYPDQVQYLKCKDAIVSTAAMPSWAAFFNQRIRWASKARLYEDKRIIAVLALVYLFNLSFLVLLITSIVTPLYGWVLLLLWVTKTVIELPFIYSVAGFFGKRSLVRYFFFFQPLHIAYTIISGFFGQLGKYEWKGRRVK